MVKISMDQRTLKRFLSYQEKIVKRRKEKEKYGIELHKRCVL